MGTGELLLRAILTNPADDTARLVYADWLQENEQGQRAAVIRLGVEIGRVEMRCQKKGLALSHTGAVGPLFVPRCRCRPCSLARAEYRAELSLAESVGTDQWMEFAAIGAGCRRQRGFVSAIRLSLAAFMEHAKVLFSAHPFTAVTLTDRLPVMEFPHGEEPYFTWFHYDRSIAVPSVFDHHWAIPTEIGGEGHYTRFHLDSQAADKWLSARCVAYGRSLAGLPPLQQG
jgi:uncharacterized protein (TIGR02996 family)